MDQNSLYDILLQSLRNDLRLVGQEMQALSTLVIQSGISLFPLFVAFREECNLGRPAFNRESHGLNWNFNASILEELVRKNLILEDRLMEFTETMGDPTEKACIFVITRDNANFVFVPYGELNEEKEGPDLWGNN